MLLLPGAYAFLAYRGGGVNLPLYVLWTWEWLNWLLFAWVPVLLGQWGRAVRLLLLVGFDVLIMAGYYVALLASSMTDTPL
jgi:hypothetical protein